MKKIFLILSLLILFVSCRKDTIFNGEGIYCDANGVGFYMVAVEGGSYYMGAQSNDPDSINYDEDVTSVDNPIRYVTVEDFYMGEIEVTQKLWETVMGNNPSSYDNIGSNKPVNVVYYRDCSAFIDKLNELTGMNFRFPTEEEWEYAARGGNKSKGYKYSGSDKIDKVAWWDGNSVDSEGVNILKATKRKLPNELGIFDMSGNVFEYCLSEDSYYGYVYRGGGYYSSEDECKVYYREEFGNIYATGLRLVCSALE